MKKVIRLTESELHKMVKNSVAKILKEAREENYLYQGNGDEEEWEMADITPWDFYLIKDDDISSFHYSPIGYTVEFNGEEFGEIWYEKSLNSYRGVSDHDMFDGYKRTFEGATLDGIIEDMCNKVAYVILNGNEEDEDY